MKKFYIYLVSLFLVNAVNAQWNPQNSGTTENLYSVHFPDASIGYAVGAHNTILKTTNGGSDWVTLVSGGAVGKYSAFFIDTLTGYVVGGNGHIKKTINGGNNWTPQYNNISQTLHSVYFPNPDTGYAVGGGINSLGYNYGIVLKTTNNGTDWIVNYSSGLTGNNVDSYQSVNFLNANLGYIVGGWIETPPYYTHHSSISKTIDGGANWSIQDSLIQIQAILNAVFFPTNETGYIVGEYGTILKTADGGINWIPQTSGTTSELNSVFFTDENFGHIVGNDGIILKTTNGGINWIPENSGTNANLSSIYFPNQDTAYIVGESGTILKTNNGGSVWINDNRISKRFLVYPNPVVNELTVEINNISNSSHVSIINLSGQELFKTKLTNSKTNLNLMNFPNGIYFIKHVNDKSVEVEKIIKD